MYACVSAYLARCRWCLRLIGQAKAVACLLNANAKLSTLGGGYFLTRQVGQAIRLARAQSQVREGPGLQFSSSLLLSGWSVLSQPFGVSWSIEGVSFSEVYRKTRGEAFRERPTRNIIALDWGGSPFYFIDLSFEFNLLSFLFLVLNY